MYNLFIFQVCYFLNIYTYIPVLSSAISKPLNYVKLSLMYTNLKTLSFEITFKLLTNKLKI